MRDAESEQPDDEFEIHIIDLDDPASDDANNRPSAPLPSLPRWLVLPRHISRTTAGTLSSGEVIVPTIRRRLPRQRKFQLAITTSLVVLTVLLILVSTPSVRNLAADVFLGPTPTIPLAPETDLFYIEANPPWGHLSVDGQPVTRLAMIGIDTPLRLSRGTHLLIWQAEP